MKKLNITSSNVGKLVLVCSAFIYCSSCSQSKEQNNFEERALQPPSGIVDMDADGTPTENGETDSTDWNIAPDFGGLIRVETPAFPNPVAFNSNFKIQISVIGVDAVYGLSIYAFRQPSELSTLSPLRFREGTLPPGGQTFRINPQEFAQGQGTGTIGNTYRIILFNRQQNVISYGDVLVK